MKILLSIDSYVSVERNDEGKTTQNIIASFAADTKAEVNDTTGENIVNLHKDQKLCLGTTVITADGYVGVLSSNETYTWKKWGGD